MTLHAQKASCLGGWLHGTWAYETEDAQFNARVLAPEPITYRWYIMYSWTNQFVELPAVTGPTLTLTIVDLWDDWTMASVLVSNAAGETLWLGPATLSVYPLAISIPGSGTMGTASRYPATIQVRGMPTNLASVRVILYNLRHTRPDDLDILLVSPSGKKIMLMSDAGGNTSITNVTIVFEHLLSLPPDEEPIWSWQTHYFGPSNYGTPVETQLPGAPPGPYSTNLFDLVGDDANGLWQLYIYDDSQQNTGALLGSWWLEFTFQ
ncbi:proprotein convertase P-domain-containing protein [Limisphaera sp. 4302-co]|uniref:proprotein convertase P-domain-containing protein n=1 Tax=Limisphaera sp. 4302-co TaxID=3400417 RepID=UPI003C1523E5